MSTLQAKPPVSRTKYPIKLIRPATIEFRFNKKQAYKQQLKLFIRALKPAAQNVITTDTSCFFPIATTIGGKKEMELRFVLLKKAQLGNTRTVVYWQVQSDSLKVISDSLTTRHGFTVLEGIQNQPIDTSTQTLLENSSDNAFVNAQGSDRTLGLVVNPPYPTIVIAKDTTANGTSLAGKPTNAAESSPSYLVWIGCIVALLIGFMVGRLGRK